MVSERYDSGDRRLVDDSIIWVTNYLKLKQYNQLTSITQTNMGNFEDMKELVKMFQDCKEHVSCIEESTICEDSGFNEEVEGQTDLKFKEEIKGICEEHIIVHEENYQEEYLNVVEKEEEKLGKMGKKHKEIVRNKKTNIKYQRKYEEIKKKREIEKDRKRREKKKKVFNKTKRKSLYNRMWRHV